MEILILQRRQSRSNAQSNDDNGDGTQAPSSCTTNQNDNTEALNDTSHVDDTAE